MNTSTARKGFEIMGALLGQGPDEATKEAMSTILLQIVDQICAQQLDARMAKVCKQLERVSKNSISTETVQAIMAEFSTAQCKTVALQALVNDIKSEIDEVHTKMLTLERQLSFAARCSHNGLTTQHGMISELTKSLGKLQREVDKHAAVMVLSTGNLKQNLFKPVATAPVAAAPVATAPVTEDGSDTASDDEMNKSIRTDLI